MSISSMVLYPPVKDKGDAQKNELQKNPAFAFFGKRLYKDQSLAEFLNELLLIFHSKKQNASVANTSFSTPLPDFVDLQKAEGVHISYATRAHLNLKLLSFWSSSRIDARHPIHHEHFDMLCQEFRNRLEDKHDKQKCEQIIHDIESLLLGFRTAGAGRTWCAQQFLPITPSFLTAEVLWNETQAKSRKPLSWEETLYSLPVYWTLNKHRFMARGGDVLYLQLCLALGQSSEIIAQWNEENDLGLSQEEQNPAWLHARLQKLLPSLVPTGEADKNANNEKIDLERLVSFIDDLERYTATRTDFTSDDTERYQDLGACSAESWREGYFFALDLMHIAAAKLDPVDKLSLVETACAMQVFRTLCMRTAALSDLSTSAWPKYTLVVSDVDDDNKSAIRALSHHTYKRMSVMMYRLMQDSIDEFEPVSKEELTEDKLKIKLEKISEDYGKGLFAKITKDLGLVVPRTGGNERFVLPERVLRLMVLTLVPAGQSLRFDTFKKLIRQRYGFVFDAAGLADANRWVHDRNAFFANGCDAWLQNMLEDANFLVRLSDSCSLVRNTTKSSLGRGE